MYFWELWQCLMQFREGSMDIQLPAVEVGEKSALRVNEQLELLAEYLSVTREQVYRDKEAVKRLVTDISHQLKTPVAALDTCFAVWNDASLQDTERKEFEQRCKSELEGLKVLLDSLLQVSRLEVGMIQIQRKKAPLLDTIINAVNRVYPNASARQIEFGFDYAGEIERLDVMQDTKWLCEAFINILDNAIKYSPIGSEVTISVHKRVSFVRIEIADSGIGIPKQEYHKVFQRFYRGKDKRVYKESGSGVGLYLAREIIRDHRGMISVKSDYERNKEYPGCKVVVRLPLIARSNDTADGNSKTTSLKP